MSLKRFFSLLLVPALLAASAARAEPKPDDYGGLNNYPIPSGDGGSSEFGFCVLYAKRAWRVGNLIDRRTITLSQAKEWARDGLGPKAAAEEIQDFERLERKEYASPNSLAAERFFRCAEQLKLNPEPRHKANAEFCFKSITLLDFVAHMRVDGKSQEEANAAVAGVNPHIKSSFLVSTVNLAYAGQSIAEGSSVIEDTFSSCFAEAGERQLAKPKF